MKQLYLFLMILGLILPYSQFIPFYIDHGMNVTLMLDQLFRNNISGFFGIDLIISAIVVIPFMISEAIKIELKYYWIPVICVVGIGLSFGLPFFLYLRERHFEKVELETFLEIE